MLPGNRCFRGGALGGAVHRPLGSQAPLCHHPSVPPAPLKRSGAEIVDITAEYICVSTLYYQAIHVFSPCETLYVGQEEAPQGGKKQIAGMCEMAQEE